MSHAELDPQQRDALTALLDRTKPNFDLYAFGPEVQGVQALVRGELSPNLEEDLKRALAVPIDLHGLGSQPADFALAVKQVLNI